MDNVFISIVGPEKDTARISNEVFSVLNKSMKVKIEPTCLARESVNQTPAWRFELSRILSQGHVHIINDAGRVNCDELLDLNRSIRALSGSYHPLVFRSNPDFLPDCEQITANYSLEYFLRDKSL